MVWETMRWTLGALHISKCGLVKAFPAHWRQKNTDMSIMLYENNKNIKQLHSSSVHIQSKKQTKHGNAQAHGHTHEKLQEWDECNSALNLRRVQITTSIYYPSQLILCRRAGASHCCKGRATPRRDSQFICHVFGLWREARAPRGNLRWQ